MPPAREPVDVVSTIQPDVADQISLPENTAPETVRAVVELAAHVRALRASLGKALDDLARWRSAALTDPVTGLLSRRGWEEWLATSSRDTPTESWGVAVIDLDDFKRVNDTGGLAQGDATLTAVGQALAQNASADDVVARWGGDEFVIALPAANRPEAADRIESFRRALGEIILPRNTHPLTASAGWAWRPAADQSSVGDLFAEAEMALRTAKNQGRNRLFPKC